MSGKIFIKTHGCQMNEYDSDKMQDVLLKSHGLSITQVEEEADVILINTCSIREKAQEKVVVGAKSKRKTPMSSLVWVVAWLRKKARRLLSARRMLIWCLVRKPFIACRNC